MCPRKLAFLSAFASLWIGTHTVLAQDLRQAPSGPAPAAVDTEMRRVQASVNRATQQCGDASKVPPEKRRYCRKLLEQTLEEVERAQHSLHGASSREGFEDVKYLRTQMQIYKEMGEGLGEYLSQLVDTTRDLSSKAGRDSGPDLVGKEDLPGGDYNVISPEPRFDAPTPAAPMMEQGIERPGADYRTFALGQDDPVECRKACTKDAKCMAWTYRRPVNPGLEAHCALSDRVPPKRSDPCCVSGIQTHRPPAP
jgi:hypothetical protein